MAKKEQQIVAVYERAENLTKTYEDGLAACLRELASLGAPGPRDDTRLGIYLKLFTERGARLVVERTKGLN